MDEECDTCPIVCFGIVAIEANPYANGVRHHDGRVFCWGANHGGVLGMQEDISFVDTPEEVRSAWASTDDPVRCWGIQCLFSSYPVSHAPIAPDAAAGLTDIVEVATATLTVLMPRADGALWGAIPPQPDWNKPTRDKPLAQAESRYWS